MEGGKLTLLLQPVEGRKFQRWVSAEYFYITCNDAPCPAHAAIWDSEFWISSSKYTNTSTEGLFGGTQLHKFMEL